MKKQLWMLCSLALCVAMVCFVARSVHASDPWGERPGTGPGGGGSNGGGGKIIGSALPGHNCNGRASFDEFPWGERPTNSSGNSGGGGYDADPWVDPPGKGPGGGGSGGGGKINANVAPGQIWFRLDIWKLLLLGLR